MTKKIIYTLVIIIVIILFTIFWKNSNKETTPVLPVVTPSTTQTETTTPEIQVDTPATINGDLDKMDINSGIDTDLNSMDGDIKTL
ncbi:MAG: hypothetical protein WCI91_01135 [Candidatus Nomurabacteria bacterium]